MHILAIITSIEREKVTLSSPKDVYFSFFQWKTNKETNLCECVSVRAAFCERKPLFLRGRLKMLQMKPTRASHPTFCFSCCFSLLPAAAHLFLVRFAFFSFSPTQSARICHTKYPAAPSKCACSCSRSLLVPRSRKTSQFSGLSCKTRHLAS